MSWRPRQAKQDGGFRWSSLLLGIGGVLVFLVASSSCLAVAALVARSNQPSSRTAAHAASPTNSTGLPTAAPTSDQSNPDWRTYSFPVYGFRVDVSGVLVPQHALLINNGSGASIDWIYQGAALGSPLRDAAAETLVRVQYSTVIADTNICPAGGTPITLGSGIPAYQQANVPPDLNGPSAQVPYVRVSLVTGGVAIRIEMEGQGDPATFFTRYGTIWQHMLASFATYPPLQPFRTHPCS